MKNYDAITPPISDHIFNVSLSAGVARTVTWPTGANNANFSTYLPIWAAGNEATAVIPSADILDGTGSAYNKAQFFRGDDSNFSIISATEQIISIEFWS